MDAKRGRRLRRRGPRAPGRTAVAVGCALLLALPLAASIAHPRPPDGRTVGKALSEMTVLTQRQVKRPADRLSRGLPADAKRLAALREPAATVQAQLGIALAELRQMSTAIVDPHYLPALLAVGRAQMAASGQDPLTQTTINPSYLGLEREIAASTASVDEAADRSAKLARSVGRLLRKLRASSRRANALERRLRRATTG